MPKRIVYTKITPLPANVPRQLALDMLHSHAEIIELNPLVTGHKPIEAPRDAARDEYFAQWYEIEEIITWGFGMKKKIAFKGCFHDMPWGLQTHIYAPLGVDLRNKYQIAGNQPGEPKEVRELGVDAPAEGLYLKEDVEITCNIALSSFVKKETKQTLLTMIERMTKKAELLDDGVLHAMFENGRLKTINPTQTHHKDSLTAPSLTDRSPSIASSPSSPPSVQQDFRASHTFTKYSNLPGRMSTAALGASPSPVYAELDASPRLDASGFSKPQNNAVEMEGSTLFVPGANERYPFNGTDAPGIVHAELADTSGGLQPKRLSHLSFSYSERQAPSTHSRVSGDSHRLSVSHAVEQDQGRRTSANSTSHYVIANPDQPARASLPYPDGPDAYVRADYQDQRPSARTSQGANPSAVTNQIGGLNISGAGT
ncbi:hypothetical protein AMS68_004582 [Peltaster fructicola]|uniref:DUF7053 domain-containing protein n=1 Tax=Peltaster fructicola TaxID=286661 RepID=A0A6H0XWM9_9PEZI|nr:hypothetical protein AMS68_004582 [Peltaster fructicola]